MFYSHEILTNEEHGVATIWLVCTFGTKGSHRRISRKSIEEVDVPAAAGVIRKPPGAPIALRLQGNLLFGLSKVFERKWDYALADAEKVKTEILLFRNRRSIDCISSPSAGKSKRDNLILLDDPAFDLDDLLPAFPFPQFDDDDGTVNPGQATRPAQYSIPAPMSSIVTGSFPPRNDASTFLEGNDPASSQRRLSSAGLSSLPPLAFGSMESPAVGTALTEPGKDEEEQIHEELDWGFEIDSEGNLLPVVPEPELPELPRRTQGPDVAPQPSANPVIDQAADDVLVDFEEPALPDAEPFSARREEPSLDLREQVAQENLDDETQDAPAASRRPRALLAPDVATKVSREQVKEWGAEYLQNMEDDKRRPFHRTTNAQAKRDAHYRIFGRGVGDIAALAADHPLAEFFGGEALESMIMHIVGRDDLDHLPQDRRRSASEAIDPEDEDNNDRRVRPRTSVDDAEKNRPGEEKAVFAEGSSVLGRGGEEAAEVGRNAGSGALTDVPSDLPWNRPSSQIPSSSVRGGGLVSNRQVSPSPLRQRDQQLSDIVRFSDENVMVADADVAEDRGAPASSSMGAPISQVLNTDDTKFLDFVETAIQEKGEERSDGKWVEFRDLVEPAITSSAAAAQAFLKVLTLATRDVIKVKQSQPFGAIHMAIKRRAEGPESAPNA